MKTKFRVYYQKYYVGLSLTIIIILAVGLTVFNSCTNEIETVHVTVNNDFDPVKVLQFFNADPDGSVFISIDNACEPEGEANIGPHIQAWFMNKDRTSTMSVGDIRIGEFNIHYSNKFQTYMSPCYGEFGMVCEYQHPNAHTSLSGKKVTVELPGLYTNTRINGSNSMDIYVPYPVIMISPLYGLNYKSDTINHAVVSLNKVTKNMHIQWKTNDGNGSFYIIASGAPAIKKSGEEYNVTYNYIITEDDGSYTLSDDLFKGIEQGQEITFRFMRGYFKLVTLSDNEKINILQLGAYSQAYYVGIYE